MRGRCLYRLDGGGKVYAQAGIYYVAKDESDNWRQYEYHYFAGVSPEGTAELLEELEPFETLNHFVWKEGRLYYIRQDTSFKLHIVRR